MQVNFPVFTKFYEDINCRHRRRSWLSPPDRTGNRCRKGHRFPAEQSYPPYPLKHENLARKGARFSSFGLHRLLRVLRFRFRGQEDNLTVFLLHYLSGARLSCTLPAPIPFRIKSYQPFPLITNLTIGRDRRILLSVYTCRSGFCASGSGGRLFCHLPTPIPHRIHRFAAHSCPMPSPPRGEGGSHSESEEVRPPLASSPKEDIYVRLARTIP